MTREEILAVARLAGLVRTHPGCAVEVVAFSRAIEAQVREECAQVLDAMAADAERDGETSERIAYYRKKAADMRAGGTP